MYRSMAVSRYRGIAVPLHRCRFEAMACGEQWRAGDMAARGLDAWTTWRRGRRLVGDSHHSRVEVHPSRRGMVE